MFEHVFPYLDEEDEEEDGDDSNSKVTDKTSYTHEQYVSGAEECLLIEEELIQLEKDDPDYLEELENDAITKDPAMVAEIIADVLKQDEKLLEDIATKLIKDAPETVKGMEGMLGENEKLHSRPDVVGYILAMMISEDENLDLLDEFDEALTALSESFDPLDEEIPGVGDEL